jgi:hypothetical protein
MYNLHAAFLFSFGIVSFSCLVIQATSRMNVNHRKNFTTTIVNDGMVESNQEIDVLV